MDEDTTQWAIIELMGHQKIAGRYLEQAGLHRVDVPETIPEADGEFRFTRLYSPQAIYSITFVDEEAARLAARAIDTPAITIWEVQREIKRLAAPVQTEIEGEISVSAGFEPAEWEGDSGF